MAGRVVDFKRQLIDGKLVVRGPVVGEDIGRQRQQLAALRVNRVHIDLAARRLFQRGHRADMVIVAVGQQDVRQRRAGLVERLQIDARLGGGIDQDAVLRVGDN